MIEMLDVILKIQDIDLTLMRRIKTKYASFKDLETTSESISEMEKEIDSMAEDLQALNKLKRKFNSECGDERKKLEEKVEKQNQANGIKEYKALGAEITAINTKITELETEAEALDRKILDSEPHISSGKEQLTLLKNEKETMQERSNEVAEKLDKEIEKFKTDRKELAKQCDETLLKTYEKLLKSARKKVVVPVSNGACSGCNITITSQQENLVRKSKHLTHCELCRSFLYITEESVKDGTDGKRKRRGRRTKAATS